MSHTLVVFCNKKYVSQESWFTLESWSLKGLIDLDIAAANEWNIFLCLDDIQLNMFLLFLVTELNLQSIATLLVLHM
jgi:hypothetical protein